MGLLVSAFSSAITDDQNVAQQVAPLFIILLIIPQITFGGGLLPAKVLPRFGQIINQVTISKWTFESLVTITGIGSDIADDKCFSEQSENKPKDLTKAEKERCTCLGSQLFKRCEFPGLKAKYNL